MLLNVIKGFVIWVYLWIGEKKTNFSPPLLLAGFAVFLKVNT